MLEFPNGQIYPYFNKSNIRAHSIDTYLKLFGAGELEFSIYPWFSLISYQGLEHMKLFSDDLCGMKCPNVPICVKIIFAITELYDFGNLVEVYFILCTGKNSQLKYFKPLLKVA